MGLGNVGWQGRFAVWKAAVPAAAALALGTAFLLTACGVETGAIHDTPADEATSGEGAASSTGDTSADADAGTSGAQTTGTMAPGTTATTDGGAAAASAAPVPAIDGGALLPRVVTSGGNVLASPRFVAMTFDGYLYRASIESFVANVGQTDFWKQTTSEYGIGAAIAGAPVHLGGTGGSPCVGQSGTCIDDAAIKNLVVEQFSIGATTFDPNTVYTIVFPGGITVTRNGAKSCTDFGGYHGQVMTTNGEYAIYAVIPTCSTSVAVGVSPLEIVTAETGHQLIDAASDPLPETSPAYLGPAAGELGWIAGGVGIAAGTELSDLCALEASSFGPDEELPDPTNANTYQYVQRSWSNAAAALGQDPCVPHAATPYFDAIAITTDTANYVYARGDGTKEQGSVDVAAFTSTTKTVDVQLIGDAAAGPFTVRAVDYAAVADSLTSGAATSYFTFAWDNGKDSIIGTAGQVVHLTITATAQATALATGSATALGAKDYPFLPIWIGSTATDASGTTTEHLSFLLTDLTAATNAPIFAPTSP